MILHDIRYALRTLGRNPGFTAVAVLALALGIGPNSAIFSIVSAVLLRPLPVHEPERVVTMWETLKSRGIGQIPVSSNDYLDWKAQSRSFESVAAAYAMPECGYNVVAGGEPERVPGGNASAEFVEVMGFKPFLGRTFSADEDRPGGPPAALVSYSFWQRRLNGDAAAVGRAIPIDGVPRTIVGVLPSDFSKLANVDIWLPTAIDPAKNARGNRNYGIFARLKPGVTVLEARAEIEGITKRLERQYPETNEGVGVMVIPMHQLFTGSIAPALAILMGAVSLLLLLACSNVANLLLARASGRRKEIALRTALGAQRGRIIRQLLTESLLLSLAGGAVGLLFAHWCAGLLRTVMPDFLPLLKQISVDWRVAAFTVAISVITGMLFGIAPAWRAARTDLNDVLKASGRAGAARDVQRIRSVLLVGEMALAVVLAAAAGLLAKSFIRLLSVNPGIRTANVLTMQVTLPWAKYKEPQQRTAFFRDVTARIESLPGVQSAGAIQALPMRSNFLNMRFAVASFEIAGEPPVPRGQEPLADYRIVTPGFFRTANVALRDGRNLSERDTADAPAAAVVNESLVRQHLKGRNPVGRRIKVGEEQAEIVGVVADVKLYGLDSKIEPAIYLPHAQRPSDAMSVLVHSTQDPASLAAAVRREVLALDAEQPIADVKTMETVVSDSLMFRRVAMIMLAVFAGLALALSTVGIYGLTAYSVTQQTQEIGVRVALGARRIDVLRLVVGRGLWLALIGTAIGTAGAFAAARVMKGLLFGVAATDATVLIAVPFGLLIVSVLASYVPARRAARVDPISALRAS